MAVSFVRLRLSLDSEDGKGVRGLAKKMKEYDVVGGGGLPLYRVVTVPAAVWKGSQRAPVSFECNRSVWEEKRIIKASHAFHPVPRPFPTLYLCTIGLSMSLIPGSYSTSLSCSLPVPLCIDLRSLVRRPSKPDTPPRCSPASRLRCLYHWIAFFPLAFLPVLPPISKLLSRRIHPTQTGRCEE